MNKLYRGERTAKGIEVTVSTPERTSTLQPDWSQQIVNHSPDGFEWSYHGSGPAQLALAILLEHFVTRFDSHEAIAKAINYHQDFKNLTVANFAESWQINDDEIDGVLQRIDEERRT